MAKRQSSQSTAFLYDVVYTERYVEDWEGRSKKLPDRCPGKIISEMKGTLYRKGSRLEFVLDEPQKIVANTEFFLGIPLGDEIHLSEPMKPELDGNLEKIYAHLLG